uniref:Uncharacterized protein n=1 Tax=Spongospora subterranea TaxID=70186 RepID=A0A0H5QV62_9EUKA|eukprot:CRZ05878.1 hypothetical protein [Spongospora subterranea]
MRQRTILISDYRENRCYQEKNQHLQNTKRKDTVKNSESIPIISKQTTNYTLLAATTAMETISKKRDHKRQCTLLGDAGIRDYIADSVNMRLRRLHVLIDAYKAALINGVGTKHVLQTQSRCITNFLSCKNHQIASQNRAIIARYNHIVCLTIYDDAADSTAEFERRESQLHVVNKPLSHIAINIVQDLGPAIYYCNSNADQRR